MSKLIIFLKVISYIIFITAFFIKIGLSSESDLEQANILFDKGEYLESVSLASKSQSIESYIFCARALAIYGHFLLKDEEAMNVFKQALEFAFLALEKDNFNDNAHVEAAHSLGRYSQYIGIVSALKEGYAEKISFHLDEAIKINPKNVSAHISKGTWHAEIVDKAGFMANILYGATSDQAREHYENALNLDGENIGVIFEVSYGLLLLDDNEDIVKAKNLLSRALKIEPKNHLDTLYIEKSKELIKIL
jgi:tetratricopeptide (TPR) repeat protein